MTEPPIIAPPAADGFDACWRRIGIQGDRSCELLAEHVHCRNCPRYAAGAMLLLDRQLSLGGADTVVDDEAAEAHGAAVDTRSALLFCVAGHWLAVPTAAVSLVAAPGPIHRLPHARSRVLLGVCNIDGALVPCLSLALLLGLEAAAERDDGSKRLRAQPRLLIFKAPGGPLVAPVDGVDSIQRIPSTLLVASPRNAGLAVSQVAGAALAWQGRSYTWLDAERLVEAMLRSLK